MKKRQDVTRWKLAAALLSTTIMMTGCGSSSGYSDTSGAVANSKAYTDGGRDF